MKDYSWIQNKVKGLNDAEIIAVITETDWTLIWKHIEALFQTFFDTLNHILEELNEFCYNHPQLMVLYLNYIQSN